MLSSLNHNTTIQVRNLSKLYQLHAYQSSLRDVLANIFKQRKEGAVQTESDNALWALKDVNFSLAKGESLGIVGPNGAGKTTILKILSHITTPTSGEVFVNGRIGGLIELGAGFHPDLTGKENIYLYGSILGLKRREIDEKFAEIVSFSGLEHFIDTPVKRYSSGMFVRLAFSVAAHTDPDILLVDEVLAVGDADFRQKCMNKIKLLQDSGVSIVFISHNLFQVRSICNQGIFLLSGQVNESGSIDHAINEYENWLRKGYVQQSKKCNFDFAGGSGGSDLQIDSINIYNSLGRNQRKFDYYEGIQARINFVARRLFSSINLAIRIVREDGLVCSLVRSADLDITVGDLEGRGYININLPEIQLVTGNYRIDVDLRDSTDGVTLSMGGSDEFQVVGPSLSTYTEGGIFIPHISQIDVIY